MHPQSVAVTHFSAPAFPQRPFEAHYLELSENDRDALERAARTGDWIGKYRVIVGNGNLQRGITLAISRAFDAWSEYPGSVPASARSIFKRIQQ